MSSSNTVLLAIDGSEGGEKALQYVSLRSRINRVRIIVVYVIEWSPYSFNTPEENERRHKRREQEIERATENIARPVSERLTAEGVIHETIVRHGSPRDVLIDLAEKYNAVQIVIGRRGQSKIRSLLFGSVVGNLVQTSPVPVVVVP